MTATFYPPRVRYAANHGSSGNWAIRNRRYRSWFNLLTRMRKRAGRATIEEDGVA